VFAVYRTRSPAFSPFVRHVAADSPQEAEQEAQRLAREEHEEVSSTPLAGVQVVAGRVWVVR
jgi:hypothetical protein